MRRRLIAAATTAALTVTLTTGTALGATADDDQPTVPKAGKPDVAAPADKTSPALDEAEGEVTVFVELAADSGVDTAEAGGDAAAVEAAAEEVTELAAEVVDDSADAETIAVTTDLVPGVVLRGDAAELRALAAKPEVTSIRVMTPKVPMNKGTDVFTKAMDAWTQTGFTGQGVTIGVIDTGLDYTHADFGGPGTLEAYAEAYGTDGTGPVPDGLYDPAKFLGGWDFAGPTYDAGGSGDQLVPQPDANPIDSVEGSTAGASHGSHVAGTAAGYGVTADGATFDGDYSALTDISDFQIGPGSAPEAGIYALKVFGDAVGSTNLTVQALEWAADPNDDGDYSDHLDIVNMSLGSDYSPADDPENDFIDELTKLGVLSVVASGNASDVVDVGGTPGNATSALTVANSVGTSFLYDAVEVTASSAVDPGLYGAQNTIAYTGADVTAEVAYIGEVEGCDEADGTNSLEAYRDQIEGKIVYLYWPEPGFACGSVARWTNAAEAGAAGAILGWEGPVFTYGLTGSSLIPGAMLTASATAEIVTAVQAGEQVTLHMGPGLANAVYETNTDAGDLVNDSSSRGVHGSLGIVKPDVAAPGTSISSVASGSGNGATTKSGTSMATPHVAGLAALVAQAHPRWTARQIKAAVMNTATHDLYTDPGQTGDVYAPERVGSGRVDALAAVTNEVIAYAKGDPALVSVTFGVVDVGARTVKQTAEVTVKNLGDTTRKFSTSFAQATGAGGATITVSPSTITLRPGRSTKVKVTLTADPASLAKEIDPTSDPLVFDVFPREYVTTISGRLVLTDKADGSTLRVPVQAAPRLVSEMSTEPVVFDGELSAPVDLTGRDVLSGGWYSIVAPMVLAAESPALPDDAFPGVAESAVKSGDLRYVGYSSTAPQYAAAGGDPSDGMLNIGIAVEGEWTSLGSVDYPVIDIDVEGDGIPDYETIIWKYAADTDWTTVETYEIVDTGSGLALGPMVDLEFTNGLPADFETTVFDNNIVVAPIWLGALTKLEPGMTPTFSVQIWSGLWDEGPIDVADDFSFDPYAPAMWFDDGSVDSTWWIDTPGTAFTAHRDESAEDPQLLMLHALNEVGSRAEVVPVTTAARAEVELTVELPRRVTTRSEPWVKVLLASDVVPTGTVEVSESGTVLGEAEVRTGRHGSYALVRLPRLAAGDHVLTVSYSGDGAALPASTEATMTVLQVRYHGRWSPR